MGKVFIGWHTWETKEGLFMTSHWIPLSMLSLGTYWRWIEPCLILETKNIWISSSSRFISQKHRRFLKKVFLKFIVGYLTSVYGEHFYFLVCNNFVSIFFACRVPLARARYLDPIIETNGLIWNNFLNEITQTDLLSQPRKVLQRLTVPNADFFVFPPFFAD